MNTLQTFSYESAKIHTIDVNGEPWFVAKDVCETIGINPSNVSDKTAHVPSKWKGRYRVATPGGAQEMLCLSEHGLYFFLNRSDKPKAIPFQEWIAGEVLPSIRKTGSYSLPAEIERKKSKELRNGLTGLWQERGAKKWDFKNLTHAEYKALGYKKVSEVKKENMTRLEIAKLAGLEMFEAMKLERNAEITGYHELKDSVLETGAAIETALCYIESQRQVRAS